MNRIPQLTSSPIRSARAPPNHGPAALEIPAAKIQNCLSRTCGMWGLSTPTTRKSPSTDRKSPLTSRKSPPTFQQLASTSRLSPPTPRKPPSTGHKSPPTVPQSGFTLRKSPPTGCKSASTGRISISYENLRQKHGSKQVNLLRPPLRAGREPTARFHPSLARRPRSLGKRFQEG